jgi:hypothetical protein
MQVLRYLLRPGTQNLFAGTASLQYQIPCLSFSARKYLAVSPEPDSIYRLNTGSYGITVTR